MISFQACANIFRSGLSKLVSPRSGPSSILPLTQHLGPAGASGRQYHSGSFPPTLSNPGSGRIFSKIEQPSSSSLTALAVGGPSTLLSGHLTPAWNPVRTILRIYWPRPRENKRIQKHGWKTRMSTPGGRRVIMRRILKGRHILSH